MTDASLPRRRVVEWDDPLIGLRASKALSGMQYVEAMKSGAVPAPPITRLVGFALSTIEPGRVVFEFTPAEEQYNPLGSVHGGILTVVLDSAMGCAVQTKLGVGQGYTTLEFKVNFVRPVTLATGTLSSEGRIVHLGARTATAEGFLRDAAGKLCAHATTTCLIFD